MSNTKENQESNTEHRDEFFLVLNEQRRATDKGIQHVHYYTNKYFRLFVS